MSLYARLMFIEEPPIPVRPFFAAVAEVMAGNKTVVQASAIIGLSAAERQQAQDLITRIQSGSPTMTVEQAQRIIELSSWRRWNWWSTEVELKTRLGVP